MSVPSPRLLSRVLPLLSVLLAASLFAPAAAKAAPEETPRRIRVVLVGDSTVAERTGWGPGFATLVTDRIELINLARGGRSSMSYIKEGLWEKALALKADYYLIQFGHNDEPGKPGRSTTMEEYRGFMNRYVDEARAIGATPVLVTSLVRRQFAKDDPHKIHSSLVPRVEAVKEIAAGKHVPLVDLHQRSLELCERMGLEACHSFSPKKPDGSYDATHLNAEGSLLMAKLVAEELRKAVPALAPCLK
jgi:pectinesterase